MSIRVFIYGSCVSRDIFNFDREKKFEIIDYYARSSLAILTSPPYRNDDALSEISSAFQRRMVSRDFSRSLLNESCLDQADIILLDLIDERFDLAHLPSDHLVTASAELMGSGFTRHYPSSFQSIKPYSTERRDLWIKGVNIFFNRLEEKDLLSRVIVNKVFWAKKFEDDATAEFPTLPTSVSRANEELAWMYQVLSRHLNSYQFLEFEEEIFRSNSRHRWGPSPFLYIDDYYRTALMKLEKMDLPRDTLEPAMSAYYLKSESTPSIEVTFQESELHAAIFNAPSDAECAFYLFRDDIRIAVKWYTHTSTCFFDLNYLPGIYRVVGFIKSEGGEVTQIKSGIFFRNSIRICVDDVDLINSPERYFKIKVNAWEFPALYYEGDGEFLFIMLSAAFDRTKFSPPIFNRWVWAREGLFPGPVICISDPTVDHDNRISLGWYLGDNGSFVLDELAVLVEAVARSRDVPKNKIVIWGSSGGGFAALALASKIPGSTAVAVNPQTNVERYEYKNKIELIREIFYNTLSGNEITSISKNRFDISTIWRNKNNISRFFLVQNKMDVHHYEAHYKPFLESLGGTPSDGISYFDEGISWLYSDDKGHAPETKDMAKSILKHVCKIKGGAYERGSN